MGTYLVFSLVFFGTWTIRDAITGNSLKLAVIGAAFLVAAYLLSHGPVWVKIP